MSMHMTLNALSAIRNDSKRVAGVAQRIARYNPYEESRDTGPQAVDLGEEILELKSVELSVSANTRSIKAESKMQKSLLDIMA
jgi:hypothetical protein